MSDFDEILYYELPPFIAQEVMIPLNNFVNDIYKAIPQLALNELFVEENKKLRERMENEDPESSFSMNNLECLILCQRMSLVKFYFNHVVIPNTVGRDNLTEEEEGIKRMCEELMEHIINIAESIFLIFPLIKEPFYSEEIAAKKKKDEEKTMGLNKKEKIIELSFDDERVFHHINALFSFFDCIIVNGITNFSERVRESDFYCITEINEVRIILQKAEKATKRNKSRRTKLSLRDVVVLLMVNNIFQKSYFSECGDELDDILASSVSDIDELAAVKIRDYMLRMAKNIEKEICNYASNRDDFKEAMQPIFDFPVFVD